MDKTTIPYKREGDYLIPDLKLKQQASIGRYGRLRMDFLKEHRPALYSKLLLSERLYDHCAEIEATALARLDLMIPQLAERDGVTEKLKAENPMEWVGQMNLCRSMVEEVVLAELIYS
ncbi:MAG: TnpV protein [Lachnospiraceae bacterium]|nr:TnpV protein [Lachnospiraceae bacterium]